MRIFSGRCGRNKLAGAVQATQPDADPGQGVGASLLPVHDADGIPDDQAGLPQRADGLRERDGAERRACEADGLRLVLANCCTEPLAERAEQLGPCLEAVLVQVIGRAAAGPQQEITLEQRVLAQSGAELIGHQSARRATPSRRCAATASSAKATVEPSSK